MFVPKQEIIIFSHNLLTRMNSIEIDDLERIITFLKDARRPARYHKYFLKSREAKAMGIKRESLNQLLKLCEALISKEWGNLFITQLPRK